MYKEGTPLGEERATKCKKMAATYPTTQLNDKCEQWEEGEGTTS